MSGTRAATDIMNPIKDSSFCFKMRFQTCQDLQCKAGCHGNHGVQQHGLFLACVAVHNALEVVARRGGRRGCHLTCSDISRHMHPRKNTLQLKSPAPESLGCSGRMLSAGSSGALGCCPQRLARQTLMAAMMPYGALLECPLTLGETPSWALKCLQTSAG